MSEFELHSYAQYAADTRYDSDVGATGALVTHDRAAFTALPVSRLTDPEQQAFAASFDVIGIDEAQFFPDAVSAAEVWANGGKLVIASCLIGDFRRRPFNSILDLLPLAECITKLTAVCTACGADASFTRRLGFETDVELIGGADKYTAACRRCFSLSEPNFLGLAAAARSAAG